MIGTPSTLAHQPDEERFRVIRPENIVWKPFRAVPAAARLALMPAGCLARWQARRVHGHIDANLAGRLDTGALANVANLSPSHFCRAFKRTFGVSVHRYVMHRRIERAQHLMLTTSEALSSIAITCGMSDQSHLTRWFRRVVGVPPAAWRRARFEPSERAVLVDSHQRSFP